MMKKNKSRPIALLVGSMLSAGLAQAQESVNASGGEAGGSGGTIAYSVGQMVYTTNSGSTGSVAQGAQQPYEISIVLGLDNPAIQLELTAYPNPTTNFLTLNVDEMNLSNLWFEIFDLQGNLVESRRILSNIETIGLENVAFGTYFLKVSSDNKEVKTFKIIKN